MVVILDGQRQSHLLMELALDVLNLNDVPITIVGSLEEALAQVAAYHAAGGTLTRHHQTEGVSVI